MADKIDVLSLVDFVDTKLLEVRRNEAVPVGAKILAYNLLIDLQELIKAEQERKDGKAPTYI